jgi:hypothetical protein
MIMEIKVKPTIHEIMGRNDKIKVKRHETLDGLLELMWCASIDELKECRHGGIDEEGNEHEYDFGKVYKSIKDMGCYGFAGDDEIHAWIGESASIEDIVHLIAHERAHFEFPESDDPENFEDELQCELVGLCARYAIQKAIDVSSESVRKLLVNIFVQGFGRGIDYVEHPCIIFDTDAKARAEKEAQELLNHGNLGKETK